MYFIFFNFNPTVSPIWIGGVKKNIESMMYRRDVVHNGVGLIKGDASGLYQLSRTLLQDLSKIHIHTTSQMCVSFTKFFFVCESFILDGTLGLLSMGPFRFRCESKS